MASLFTEARQIEMYRFTTVAFSAAPGVFFLNQLREAVEAGLSTRQIVNLFTTKSEFLSVYPASMSNEVFATALAHNVIKSSAGAGAITQAILEIVNALNAGLSRGDVIFNVFGQLADRVTTPGVPGFNSDDPYLGCRATVQQSGGSRPLLHRDSGTRGPSARPPAASHQPGHEPL